MAAREQTSLGFPEDFETFATTEVCIGCGERVDQRYIKDYRCPGCRYGGDH